MKTETEMEPLPNEPTPIEPCEHMRDYVSALSDDTLRGPARWYTQLHASYCPHCGPALRLLRLLRTQLISLRHAPSDSAAATLTENRREALQKAMEAADGDFPSEEHGVSSYEGR